MQIFDEVDATSFKNLNIAKEKEIKDYSFFNIK